MKTQHLVTRFLVLFAGAWAMLAEPASPQDAAPADRNVVNTTARPGGMMADSPVTFPKTGALPAKYPPDVQKQRGPAEAGYYLFSSPCRSLAQIAKIQSEMPKGEFTPPPPDWTHLQKTRRILTEGGPLRLLAMGDSIVNDTMRSGWVAKLQEVYPKASIQATVYVRGGGGCQHYKEEGRVAKNVVPRKPDLVFIGGISQKDIASIREVVHQLRAALPEVEILLASGAFGTVDPRDAEALARASHSGTGAYGASLKKLAAEERCAYIDLTAPWAEYIRSAKVHPHLFYRDAVHANEFGEQILSKILMAFWGSGGRDAVADSTEAATGTSQATGGDYYVGGAGASDRNPGTASQPFATIQKAASVAAAGDFVKIRAGTYRETITPANSGTPGHPITFQPDRDAVVTVSGTDAVDGGWTVYRGSVYQKTIALPLTGYRERITGNATLLANQVFVGGKMMIEARWPNVANSDDLLDRADFRPVPKGAWTTGVGTTLRDAGIPDIPGGWTGGTIWFIGWYQPQSSTITASSAGQIQFPATAEEKFHDSYYLTGRLGALDAEKEWFYDGTKLFLWAPGGGSPANVEVKQRNYAFDLSGKSNITVKKLRVVAATITTDSNSTDVTLDGLKAQYVSHFVTVRGLSSHRTETGLRLMGANSVIKNSLVEYSAGVGIALGGDGAVADNNLVHDVSYGGTYCCGIWPAPGGARQTITHNTIYRTGRSGIDGVYSNKDIGYNDIYDFGLINTDLGAIYAANGADLTGTRVHHNWFHDAKNEASHQFPVGAGIYFDQNAKPAQVDHNVFWNNHKNDVRLEQGSAPFHRIFNNTMASTEANFWFTFHSYPAGSPSDSRNNIYRSSIKPDTPGSNEMTSGTDPRFVNAGEGGLRYRLQANSPAIDRGAVIAGVTDGHVGSTPDLGAYEYGGTDWVAGCSISALPQEVE